MKKKKLKIWVKIVLLLIAFVIIYFLISKRIETLKQLTSECDKEKGYTCSYYDINKKIYAPSQK